MKLKMGWREGSTFLPDVDILLQPVLPSGWHTFSRPTLFVYTDFPFDTSPGRGFSLSLGSQRDNNCAFRDLCLTLSPVEANAFLKCHLLVPPLCNHSLRAIKRFLSVRTNRMNTQATTNRRSPP